MLAVQLPFCGGVKNMICGNDIKCMWIIYITKQGKSEGFDSCDRPSNLTQIGFKLSIFQPVWPWNLMNYLKKS